MGRVEGNISKAALVAAIVIGGSVAPPPARASADISVNGRYKESRLATGPRRTESFQDQATVRSVWTVSSSCSDAQECTGTVSSDQGWSAPLDDARRGNSGSSNMMCSTGKHVADERHKYRDTRSSPSLPSTRTATSRMGHRHLPAGTRPPARAARAESISGSWWRCRSRLDRIS